MNSLFAPKPNAAPAPNSTNTSAQLNQNDADTLSYVQEMLKRSGGDAKAAFYLAAKEKGIDPNQIINKTKQSIASRNPQLTRLMSLFSLVK